MFPWPYHSLDLSHLYTQLRLQVDKIIAISCDPRRTLYTHLITLPAPFVGDLFLPYQFSLDCLTRNIQLPRIGILFVTVVCTIISIINDASSLPYYYNSVSLLIYFLFNLIESLWNLFTLIINVL